MIILRTLFTLLLISTAVCGQKVGPRISAPDNKYDFGDIIEGDKVSHEFTIANSGDALLEITKVKASCGCTAAKPAKNKLEPGESTTIRVNFNSARRRGKQKKYVYIFSNDKVNPQFRLSFTTNILEKDFSSELNSSGSTARLVLSKKQHNFGDVKEGQLVDLVVKIKNTGNKKLSIERVRSSCGCTAAVLSKKDIAPNETADLKIELDTSDRRGKLTRTVTIHSNDSVEPQQTITLFVNIEDRNS